MTSTFPKSQEILFGAAQKLCRFVAEATDNRFQIEANAAGELATSRQALDVVTSGVIDCAYTPLALHADKDMTLGLGTGLPFGLNARYQQSWWWFGGGDKIVNAALERLGTYGIPAGRTGTQMGAWFKWEIDSLDDLKGLRFRINGLAAPIFAKIGAVPVDMPHADVVDALKREALDGAEFLCPEDDERLGLASAAWYNYGPCWWESAGMVHLVVNLARWGELPKSYRAILTGACDAVNQHMLAEYDYLNPLALRRLISAGVVLKPFPRQVLEACHRATMEHFGEVAAKDAQFKTAMESALAFQRERLEWLEHADHAFDDVLLSFSGRM